MNVIAQPEKIQVQYHGYFAEPAFAVLGNPATLYTHLLRQLRAFGATVDSLNINLAVLGDANVTCALGPMGIVRVWINRLEVLMSNAQSEKDFTQVLTAAWSVLEDTDPSLRPVRHDIALATWSRLQGEVYSTFIQRFVNAPQTDATSGKPTIILRSTAGNSVLIDEAASISEGLFLRSTLHLGVGEPNLDRLMTTFRELFGDQLKALGLEMALRLE